MTLSYPLLFLMYGMDFTDMNKIELKYSLD